MHKVGDADWPMVNYCIEDTVLPLLLFLTHNTIYIRHRDRYFSSSFSRKQKRSRSNFRQRIVVLTANQQILQLLFYSSVNGLIMHNLQLIVVLLLVAATSTISSQCLERKYFTSPDWRTNVRKSLCARSCLGVSPYTALHIFDMRCTIKLTQNVKIMIILCDPNYPM